MSLSIRKLRRSSHISTKFRYITFSCFSDTTAVNPGPRDGGSLIPPNDPSAYDFILLDVDNILPSPLTPMVQPPPVPEPVSEMQAPALFTMAQASPQPQSVDLAAPARVNPLPSPATSSSSSGELHLYIGSDTRSHTATMGPPSSSKEFLLQGQQPVSQPPHSFTLAPQSVPLPPTQPPHSSSWADEVELEQSGHSTPETVVPNWAYFGRISGPALVHDHSPILRL